MQRITGRVPPHDTGRLSRAVVWLGVAVRLGVSLCFLVMAGWSWAHHQPALLVIGPVVLAVIGGAFTLALALGQRQ